MLFQSLITQDQKVWKEGISVMKACGNGIEGF